MKHLTLLTLLVVATPFAANADYICTYKNWYGLEDDGSMTNSTKGFLMNKRFTVNMNGETNGGMGPLVLPCRLKGPALAPFFI
jgi:hypothetical protein